MCCTLLAKLLFWVQIRSIKARRIRLTLPTASFSLTPLTATEGILSLAYYLSVPSLVEFQSRLTQCGIVFHKSIVCAYSKLELEGVQLSFLTTKLHYNPVRVLSNHWWALFACVGIGFLLCVIGVDVILESLDLSFTLSYETSNLKIHI